MIIRIFRWGLALAAMLAMMISVADAASPKCLPYDKPVTVSGFVLRGLLPGAPNYENIATGDTAQQVTFLLLTSPLCMLAEDGDPETAQPAYDMVEMLQIGWRSSPSSANVDTLQGRAVTFRGALAGAVTGNHHTRVLLMNAVPVK